MPIFDYRCDDGHEFEFMQPVKDRATATCPSCRKGAKLVIRRTPMLDPRMGTDPAFASMAKKWDKKHRALATGRMKDSNATRFGTSEDVERGAHRLRKLYES
jgi:putative FmdB family regulatory protein